MSHIDRTKPKVLMVTTSFPVGPNKASGIFVKRLASALSDQVTLTVLTPGSYDQVETDVDYQIKCFRYAPYKWQRLAHEPGGIFVALRTNRWLVLLLPIFVLALFVGVVLHGRKADIIHANWSVTGFIAGLAALLIGKPVITTLRGTDVSSIRQSAISRLLTGMTLRLSRLIVAVSETIANELRQLWPERARDVFVVPNGVEESLLALKSIQKKEGLVVTTIGNLIPLKDVATIIRAIPNVMKNTQLRVIGEGVERAALENLSHELGVAEQVAFIGAIPPENIKKELSMTDIFVLSSHSEGRPNVILEAMAAGCAIISSDLPGVRELIDEDVSGLFFEPGDVSALSHHLERLIENEQLRSKLGLNARSRIIDMELTWPMCGARYVGLYNSLLELH
ncbi:MAG: glycosyltransferase family 4 protein [Candidatus Thiodiazotropha sp. (ex Dulcina madagascariensis)]|nr:glycosyltransferase family 4 protein [Candidatus Thiodiazotropha sp. (ex Dulcina madagascariensis)]